MVFHAAEVAKFEACYALGIIFHSLFQMSHKFLKRSDVLYLQDIIS